MGDVDPATAWQRSALWLALGVGTVMLVVRLLLDSIIEEAIALALLTSVVIYALAFVANRPPRPNGAKGP